MKCATVARIGAGLVALFGCIAAPGAAAPTACQYPYPVGYRVATLAGLRVAIWYPTQATPAPYAYSDGFSGVVARDAAPGCGRLPLVVFSHGLGGCGTQSLFFTEELARHGYVVAAPDHRDATFCTVDRGTGNLRNLIPQSSLLDPKQWTPATYADRKNDLEALINALLVDPVFGDAIDSRAIGAAGHSLGGYTVVGLGGGWPGWRDGRIRAVLALSPYVQPYTVHGTLAALRVPVMYQGAPLDLGITPSLDGPKGAYAQTPAPKYFVELRTGTHLVWTGIACDKDHTVRACLDRPEPRLITAYGVAFFDRYLKGMPTPLLAGNGVGLAAYRFTP